MEVVAKAVRRARAGLGAPDRPWGSFMFLGPTGVGKTHLSKALADIMFGDEGAMIRIDMSEYMERHSVSKLIGSPPGYVGYGDGGQLTEKVRRRPYCVLLFDEIEKAHPDVFNILLQILDDGSLTDSRGRRVDFRNTVVIMTSNVGARDITEHKSLGFTAVSGERGDIERRVNDALKGTFRPEFLNRIDEKVVFNQLSCEDVVKIASLMLSEVKARMSRRGIAIEFEDDVAVQLAKDSYDAIYGARPLRRAIVRRVEDSLCEAVLSGDVGEGDSVLCRVRENGIAFEKEGESIL